MVGILKNNFLANPFFKKQIIQMEKNELDLLFRWSIMNTNPQMNIPPEIETFQGKRNSVLTLFIPPLIDFKKEYLESIKRNIKSIKHSNKRGQALRVIDRIFAETKDIKKYESIGKIICCGLSLTDDIVYIAFSPPIIIKSFEYYFDYVFNLQRIYEIFNSDVIKKISNEDQDIRSAKMIKLIEDDIRIVAIGDNEIAMAIELKILEEIYYLSNEDMNPDLIRRVRDANTNIIKIDPSRDLANKLSKLGNMIGLLRYRYDFNFN